MSVNAEHTSAYPKPHTLLEDWAQIASSADWEPGQQLGPYVLKQRLGKGGMGVVWLAEQLTPLKRYVAIKLMAHEQRSAVAEAYFEIERQALAQLSHRAIAQIYDAGRLPDGALFFAMEYVPGAPLDQFQREHPLKYSQLARLFVQIASGVQHAHQRGLIHRDLKPLNVLVHVADGEALPKIIDFGIAMGSTPGAAMKIDQSRSVGTPAYMSPEQKRPNDLGIDARTDIYALGMMLAEALARCGNLKTESGAIDSTVFRNAVQKRLSRGLERGIDSEFLDKALVSAPKELLAVAAKALSPERDERYESAASFADDLGRWLQRRPVLAYSQSPGYSFWCLVRRNRIASVAATLIVLAIASGTLLALHGMRQAQAAQTLAEQRRNDAERLIQYMLGDFADKLRPIGRLDLLDGVSNEALRYLGATVSIDEASGLVRARALRTLGEVQVTRQQFPLANETLTTAAKVLVRWEEAAQNDDLLLESGTISYWRGMIAFRQDDFPSAERHWRHYLAAALTYSQRAPNDAKRQLEVAYANSNLGTLARSTGDFQNARRFFAEALNRMRAVSQAGIDVASDIANTQAWLADVYLELGDEVSAWTTTNAALQLVGDSEPQNAIERQMAINFRTALGLQAVDLGLVDIARAQLTQALQLSEVDIENDQTQPRRLAIHARILIELSRLPGANFEALMARAERIAGEPILNQLTASELAETKALSVVARAERGGDALPTIEEMRASIESLLNGGEWSSIRLARLYQCMAALARVYPKEMQSHHAALEKLAAEEAVESRPMLRLRLARLRVMREIGPADLAMALDRQIRETRVRFSNTTSGGPNEH